MSMRRRRIDADTSSTRLLRRVEQVLIENQHVRLSENTVITIKLQLSNLIINLKKKFIIKLKLLIISLKRISRGSSKSTISSKFA